MTSTTLPPRPPDLSNLQGVALPPTQSEGLARMHAACLGSGTWRAAKQRMMRKLFGLEQLAAGRLVIRAADLTTDVRLLVQLDVPVPCLPSGASEHVVERGALLAIVYPEELLRAPVPGAALVGVLEPGCVHHPNVSSGAPQRLCLGVNVPRAFPLHEVVLAAYAALSLQAVTLDERDHAGVMNPEAALYWQAHGEQIPLTREPFLGAQREGAK